MGLVLEQEIVHGPKPPLGAGTLRRFRGRDCMRVDLLQREMTIDEPYPTRKATQEQLDRRSRLFAVRTLEISVLDNRDRRVGGTDRVIGVGHRYCQFKRVTSVHLSACVYHSAACQGQQATAVVPARKARAA